MANIGYPTGANIITDLVRNQKSAIVSSPKIFMSRLTYSTGVGGGSTTSSGVETSHTFVST